MSTDSRRLRQTRWNHPALTLSLGAVLGAAAWAGGNPATGLTLFAVCAILSLAVVVATARSEWFRETYAADERWSMVDMRAGRLAALAMSAVLLADWVYQLAQGDSLDPWAALALGVGGLTYALAQLVLARRS